MNPNETITVKEGCDQRRSDHGRSCFARPPQLTNVSKGSGTAASQAVENLKDEEKSESWVGESLDEMGAFEGFV